MLVESSGISEPLPVPSPYLSRTFPVPSLYLPCQQVLVESSGISEPLPVAETFTFRDKSAEITIDLASRQL